MVDTEGVARVKNYAAGLGGLGLSLADVTGFLQFVAALAGAILVCRQLMRDFKRKKELKDGENPKS